MFNLKQENYSDQSFLAKPGLENLFRRLKKGMKIKGRIVENFNNGHYLLRIWGYNILTDSRENFNKHDEVDLTVIQVEPHLVLDFSKSESKSSLNNNLVGNTNIIIE